MHGSASFFHVAVHLDANYLHLKLVPGIGYQLPYNSLQLLFDACALKGISHQPPCLSTRYLIPLRFVTLPTYIWNTKTVQSSGSTNCTICPAGYTCSTPSALPVACAEGEYSAEGSSTCSTCPAGFYCPGPPFDEASKAACSLGQYSLGGTTVCFSCPKGYYCPDTSQAPEACSAGYVAYRGNQTTCERCVGEEE